MADLLLEIVSFMDLNVHFKVTQPRNALVLKCALLNLSYFEHLNIHIIQASAARSNFCSLTVNLHACWK